MHYETMQNEIKFDKVQFQNDIFKKVVRSNFSISFILQMKPNNTFQDASGCHLGPYDSRKQNEWWNKSQKSFSSVPGTRLRAASEVSTSSLAGRLVE